MDETLVKLLLRFALLKKRARSAIKKKLIFTQQADAAGEADR